MSIDRNNYESYFILYLDNELSLAERRMVESFIQLHPDLKEELDLLGQFKLTPDTSVVFEGKEELMMHQDASEPFMNNTLLQNSLLLYIDGELTPAQQLSLEEIIATKPLIQAELELLRRAKLRPEEIVFKDKASLYRKQRTQIFDMPVRWWRMAAAAVLLIAVGLTSLFLVNKKSVEPEMAKTTPVQQLPAPVTKEEIIPQSEKEIPLAKTDKNILIPVAIESNSPALAIQKNNSRTNNVVKAENKPVVNEMPANNPDFIAEKKSTNNLPAPVKNPNFNTDNTNADVTNNTNTTSPDKNVLTNTDVTTAKLQPYIKHASHANDVAIEQPDSKKGKLRGFFRKVTRTFEKRTNIETTDDDNKLLVAGLAFKLK